MKVDISVIVPVYNVANYLDEIVSLIESQKQESYEWLFIDDGSTDNSLAVLRELESRNRCVRVFVQENSGQGAARNFGLDVAEGEYVGFLDPDDTFFPSMYTELYAECKRLDLDVGVCGYNYVDPANDVCLPRKTSWESRNIKDWAGQPFTWLDFAGLIFSAQRTCWNKLYRREWLLGNSIAFSESRMYEDSLFYFLSVYYAERMGFLDKRLYNYRYRRSGASSSRNEKTLYFGPISRECLAEMKKRDCGMDFVEPFVRYTLNRSTILRNRAPMQLRTEFDGAMASFRGDAAEALGRDYRRASMWPLRIRAAFPAIAFRASRAVVLGRRGFRWGLRQARALMRPFRRSARRLASQWKKRHAHVDPSAVRHTQVAYQRVLQRLSYRLGLVPTRVRVGFLVRENSKWTCQHLYDLMGQDPLFEPVIVLSVHRSIRGAKGEFHRTSHSDNIAFFERRGMRYVEAYDSENDWFKDLRCFALDVLFYDQPYGLPTQHHPRELATSLLTAYVPYGYGIYLFDDTLQLSPDFLGHTWGVFLESETYLEGWDRTRLPEGPRYFHTGYPKMDTFALERQKPGVASGRERMTVIYAPHHSVDPRHPYSLATFGWSGQWMLDYAKRHPEVDWVFKPHPKLRQSLIAAGLLSPAEVDSYFDAWGQLPGSQVIEEGDYLGLFARSDLMVTDCGSFLVEYLYTGKPLVRLVNADGDWLSAFARRFMALHYSATSPHDAEAVLDSVFACNGDGRDDERRALVDAADETTASERVLASLRQSLKTAEGLS